jgi:hypothetical protein
MANSSYPVRAASPRTPSYPPGYHPEPQYLVTVPRRRVSFWRDLYNGAVLGDFAREKRLGGALVQILFGFTPGVGTVCAARDCVADMRYRDLLGFCLNLLALVPVVGGLSKTLDVLRGMWHAHHVLRTRKHQQPYQRYYVPLSTVPTQPLPHQPLPQRSQRPLQLPPPTPPQTHPHHTVDRRR